MKDENLFYRAVSFRPMKEKKEEISQFLSYAYMKFGMELSHDSAFFFYTCVEFKKQEKGKEEYVIEESPLMIFTCSDLTSSELLEIFHQEKTIDPSESWGVDRIEATDVWENSEGNQEKYSDDFWELFESLCQETEGYLKIDPCEINPLVSHEF